MLPPTHLSSGNQKEADLQLKLNGLSRKHIWVKYLDGKIFLEDVGSTLRKPG